MKYTIKLKGEITIEADSESQALDRAFEVIETIEDSTHNYDACILLDTKSDKIKVKKDNK